ncbi:MAG: S1C family serine protease [Candidatus Dormibacteria bacterium]
MSEAATQKPEAAPSDTERRRGGPRLLAAVVLSAVIGCIGGGLGAWAVYSRFGPVQQIVSTPIRDLNGSGGGARNVNDIAAATRPSLVTIATRPVAASGLLDSSAGLVNGFVVSADGLVVTSAHALQGATRLRVGTADGHAYDAQVITTDVAHGLVAIRATGASGLSPLSFAASAPTPGDLALAISRPPLGATSSLGVGTVSSTGRAVEIDRSANISVVDALTVNASPEPQADGAPVVDGTGKVIGVVVAITAATPPAGLIALSGAAAAALAGSAGSGAHSNRATLGADSAILDPAAAAAAGLAGGALVRSIDPDGPAARAGIRSGDIVTAVNGVPIGPAKPFDATALGVEAGQQLQVIVGTAGASRTVVVIVGSTR